MHGTPRICNF